MPYNPTTWNNGAGPAITAPKLNQIEQGIKGAWENPVFRKDSTDIIGFDPNVIFLSVSNIYATTYNHASGHFYLFYDNGIYIRKPSDWTAYFDYRSVPSGAGSIEINKTKNFLYSVTLSPLSSGIRISLARSGVDSSGALNSNLSNYGTTLDTVATPIEQYANRASCLLSDTELLVTWGGNYAHVINISSSPFTYTTTQINFRPRNLVRSPDGNYYCLLDNGTIEKRNRNSHALISQKKLNLFFLGGYSTELIPGDEQTFFYITGKVSDTANASRFIMKVPTF